MEEIVYARKFLLFVTLLAFTLLGCELAEQTVALTTPITAPTAAIAEATPTTAPTDTPQPTVEVATPTEAVQVSEATPTQAQPQASPTPAGVRETEEAASMAGVIQRLSGEGVLGSTAGEYYRLNDFDESWAQIGWYQWWTTGYSAENFVITANTTWESASETANWPEAGCGFVFSHVDSDNYYLAYLGLDGIVRFAQNARGNLKLVTSKRFGRVSIPNGEAQLMLVANAKHIYFYVNNQQVVSANAGSLQEGDIALTLLSGTNRDFGTRCQMTNIDLWVIE
jgi:hypothetical protein